METEPTNPDIISSWIDSDDIYIPAFPPELQEEFENSLLNFEIDGDHPVSSLATLESPLFDEFYNFDDAGQAALSVELETCDAFLNDSEFEPISPSDMSPEYYFDSVITEMSQPVVTEISTGLTDRNEEDHGGDEDEESTDDDRKPGMLNCKNLVSERNRRKRLGQQLLSLRALVPTITKMDKRSILIDALAYLKNIHEETEMLQNELKEHQQRPRLCDLRKSSQDNPTGSLRIPRSSAPKQRTLITVIDTEKIEDKRFVVKITATGSAGLGSDILRVLESLDFEITYTSLQQLHLQEVLATIFIRVRKHGKMTEQKMKDCIRNMALKRGITFQHPCQSLC